MHWVQHHRGERSAAGLRRAANALAASVQVHAAAAESELLSLALRAWRDVVAAAQREMRATLQASAAMAALGGRGELGDSLLLKNCLFAWYRAERGGWHGRVGAQQEAERKRADAFTWAAKAAVRLLAGTSAADLPLMFGAWSRHVAHQRCGALASAVQRRAGAGELIARMVSSEAANLAASTLWAWRSWLVSAAAERVQEREQHRKLRAAEALMGRGPVQRCLREWRQAASASARKSGAQRAAEAAFALSLGKESELHT